MNRSKIVRIAMPTLLVGTVGAMLVPVSSQSGRVPAAQIAEPRTVVGLRVQPIGQAVVDFDALSRRQALMPKSTTAIARAVPEPGEVEEIEIEPPASFPMSRNVDQKSPMVASPSPAISYEGEFDEAVSGTGFYTIPPDTMGQVGTDALNKTFTTLNNNYRIQNKTTGASLGLVSMDSFWAGAGATSPFDPRVLYDPFNDRWIVAATTEALESTTSILIGISDTGDPAGTYHTYKFPARVGGDPSTTNFADFPMLGFNKNWVVVSINMFNSSGSFVEDRMLVIDYPSLRANTFSATYFTGIGAFCLHPATTYSSSENTEYLVDHRSSAGATYGFSTITGTAGSPIFTLGGNKTRPGGAWVQPTGNILPQAMGTCASTPLKMDVGDANIRHNVVFRNGQIYYAQTVGLPSGGMTHTAVQWTALDTSGNVVQGARIDDATATASNGGKWYAYPSIAVNGNDDILIGFGQFTSADFASSAYAYHHHTDSAGTTRDPFVYKAGLDCYSKHFGTGRNRWGDYSHTMVDPTGAFGTGPTSPAVASNSFWTIQEFARLQAPPALGPEASTSKWSTYWAKVVPPGAAPFTDDPLVQFATPVKAVHITELRTRINNARTARGMSTFGFAETLTQFTTTIKASHINELRQALDEIYTHDGLSHAAYTDAPLVQFSTKVKAQHITELRTFLAALE